MLAGFTFEQGSAIRTTPVGEEALLGWLDAIIGALYLGEFVSTSALWAHLDIMAANPAAKPGRPDGGEATGMRALYTDIRQLYA